MSSEHSVGTVRVFASEQSWIESEAVEQCRQVAALPNMVHVAGQPDLHPGKGGPIGAAMLSYTLYPHLVEKKTTEVQIWRVPCALRIR